MDQNDDLKLFSEFPPIPTEAWEQKIVEDLKGGDYEKKLIWKPMEGLNVKPYYRSEDLEKLSHTGSMPGAYPFIRGNKELSNAWEIRQDIDVDNIADANKKAVTATQRGAEGLNFRINQVSLIEEVAKLLSGLDLTKTALHFSASSSYSILAEILLKALEDSFVRPKQLKGSFNFDSLSYYFLHGEFYNSAADNFNEAACLIGLVQQKLPGFRVININAQHFHNAGANAIQELAWGLASASEYFQQMTERKIEPNEVAARMQLTLATGSDYFLEIARIRAARMLWAQVAEQYGCSSESRKAYIHCVNSTWNKTVFDPWVNMLRSTTEAMSASIAGADAITNVPVNTTYRTPDAFAVRTARNTQIILKEESNLDKIVDPSAGSYYIEQLTDSIAKLAWDEFVKIEEMGGIINAFESGYLLQEVKKTCQKRDMDIATRKISVLGTNIFPNLQEEMLDDIKKDIVGKKSEGLKLYRGAEAFETLRLTTEKYKKSGKKRPSVLLIGYGNLAMRKARANFAANFFGVAGYEILDEFEALQVKDVLYHIMEKDPSIVVYCSSDEEYSGMATDIMKAAAKEKSITALHVIAGYPKEQLEALKSAGAHDFIHVRSNLLEVLQGYNEKLMTERQ